MLLSASEAVGNALDSDKQTGTRAVYIKTANAPCRV